MDNFESQKKPFYLLKELKNLPKPPQKETISLLNLQKKNNIKKTQKQNLPQTTKIQTGNVIKETIVFNIPNKVKSNNLEKLPNTKNNQNKIIYQNNLDYNPTKKKAKEKNKSPEKMSNNKQEIEDYKKYNSVCVSINNNYNYNVSLGNSNSTNDKFKEKAESWQEKMQRINKQKENMNYLDYKKLTESEFFKNKILQKEKEEKEQKLNKSENDYIFKQKIKEMNSAPPPNIYNINNYKKEKNKDIKEEDIKDNLNINNEIKNIPKKKSGILGFLQAFKDLLEPINIRKKANITNIKDNYNKNNSNNNNRISVNLKTNENKKINIPTTPKIDNTNNNYNNNYNNNLSENNINNNKYINNSVNVTPKISIYERKNILNKNNENNNYYSDDAYDSCPVTNNTNYKYTHKNLFFFLYRCYYWYYF